jgi:hypothetical protein
MLTTMRTLDEQATILNTMTEKNKQVEWSTYSKKTQAEQLGQLDQVAQTDKALQAMFKESRVNHSCTWEDVGEPMNAKGMQQSRQIRLAWIASEKGE